ncbi:MAG: peptidoglycan DD-metalloendopeptidase family protein [Candidatus Promineifilaceae bacterium]|nr:peptidoglycan DD-metalloendopeptidase family protein [Candidatus Promineifilaceae bacterium]
MARMKEVNRRTMSLSQLRGATHVRVEVSRHAGPGWWEKLDAVTVPLDGETRLEIVFLEEQASTEPEAGDVVDRPEPGGAGSSIVTRFVTATTGLNLRAGPSSDNEILGTLSFGTEVRVLEEHGAWARVRAGRRLGFVSSEFLAHADPMRTTANTSEEPGGFHFSAWPTVQRRINQHFGVNPEDYRKFGLPGHEGIDLGSPLDTPYFCVAPGEVIWVSDRRRSSDEPSAYGWHVIVDHGNGYSTLYAHARPDVPVKPGDRLEAGDVVAFSGNTGNSSGPHLHLTLKKKGHRLPGWPEGYMDPWPLLRDLSE